MDVKCAHCNTFTRHLATKDGLVCTVCLKDKGAHYGAIQAYGIGLGVFCLSEDAGQTIASEIRNALGPMECLMDEYPPSKEVTREYESLRKRLLKLASAFDGSIKL